MSPAGETSPFDPLPILIALADAKVDFVLIGGLAGNALGSSQATYDVDVAYSREPENLERLAGALTEIGAELRVAGLDDPSELGFQLDAETLRRGANFTFNTRLGPLDILAEPAGMRSYTELRRDSLTVEIDDREIRIASLDHLIAMKQAAGRPKDRIMVEEYIALAEERRHRAASGEAD